MTRQEFSEMLVKARKAQGFTGMKVCFKLGVGGSQLNRIEKGTNNYNMIMCFAYLDAIGACLIITLNKVQYRIPNYDNLMGFVQNLIGQKNVSRHQFAKSSDLFEQTLYQLATGKITMTINVLLKLANALDFTLSLGRK